MDMKELREKLEATRMHRIARTTFSVPVEIHDIIREVQHVRGLCLRQFIDNAVKSIEGIDVEKIVVQEVQKEKSLSIAMSFNALQMIIDMARTLHVDRNSALTWIINYYLTTLDFGEARKVLGHRKINEEVEWVCKYMGEVSEHVEDIAKMHDMELPPIAFILSACLDTLKNGIV